MSEKLKKPESIDTVHTHTHGTNVLKDNKVKRENNYDLLRIICAISVIVIHVSNKYLKAYTNSNIFGEVYNRGIIVSCMYNVLTRFAVPCFFMLSGAFLLSNNKNKNYKAFYKKSFNNIGIHGIIFSVIYFIYCFIKAILLVIIKNKSIDTIYTIGISGLIKGAPIYHMWYLYSLIGIYLLVPVVIRLKDDIGEKNFFRLSIIFLILSCISFNTSSHFLYWDIGLSFEYLAYFMIGYIIRIKSKDKNIIKSILWIVLGILVELIVVKLRVLQEKGVILTNISGERLVTPLSPLIVISSMMIFKGFSVLEIKKDLTKLSSLTLYIYLIHIIPCELLLSIIRKIGGNWNNMLAIPVISFLVLVISIVLSIIYSKIYQKIIDMKGEKQNV